MQTRPHVQIDNLAPVSSGYGLKIQNCGVIDSKDSLIYLYQPFGSINTSESYHFPLSRGLKTKTVAKANRQKN